MTNDEAVNALAVLAQCKETGRLGYAIAKNMTKLKAETAEYSAFRDEALTKYGTPVMHDGRPTGTFTISGENVAKYREELGDIPSEEIDFKPYTVSEDVFIDSDLNSAQMAALMWMVE